MDKESKITVFLLISLTAVSAMLLIAFAKIPFFSLTAVGGFLAFIFYLTSYLIFASQFFASKIRGRFSASLWKKFLFPALLLSFYSIFSLASSTFAPLLFFKLAVWFFAATLIFSFSHFASSVSLKDFFVALLLWLPIEFGQFAGFDIDFGGGIVVPAIPFVAVGFGLYLFSVLRQLPGIGFTFNLEKRDFIIAGLHILILAILLIPLGTALGFIRFSSFNVSFGQAVQLIFGIYFLVALPEELLFRGIIQNLIAKLLFKKSGVFLPLILASLIFGFSHWNNFTPTDWRYVFLASIAGIAYGVTYIKTGKTTASALVHCGVNFFWAVFFPESRG